MNKTDCIARKILGWKLNRWDRWYDYEKGVFISDSEFQPEENLGHAMLIVERLEKLGYTFTASDDRIAGFNGIMAAGETMAQAITNAAYSIIEQNADVETSRLWSKLC